MNTSVNASDDQERTATSPASQRSVVIALFSIGGSVGKSQIGLGLYKYLLNFKNPRLLVDADLVAGTLSVAAGRGDVFTLGEANEWTLKTLTSAALLERDTEITAGLTFLPAAEWVLCDVAIKRGSGLPMGEALARRDVRVVIDAEVAQERLKNALFTAQEQQARFNSDISAQRRLWRNICRFAIKNRGNVIVDLPAQGPSGVAIERTWALICEDARRIERDVQGGGPVELRRMLVYTADDHPLVKHFREARAADLTFVRNMADGEASASAPNYIIPLADVGNDLLGPSPLRALIESSGSDKKLKKFQTFVSAIADDIFQ